MEQEIINRVEVMDTGELLLGLQGQGSPIYQYVYREAAGVYWDDHSHGFKSTPMDGWPCSKWFFQIVGVVKSGLGVELILGQNVVWSNIPAQERLVIENGKAI